MIVELSWQSRPVQAEAEIFMYLKMLELYLPCRVRVWLGDGQSHWSRFKRVKESEMD